MVVGTRFSSLAQDAFYPSLVFAFPEALGVATVVGVEYLVGKF
jgi:hypothetical protein